MSRPTLSKMLVIVRGVAYATAFVLLWAWLAASVQRFDTRWPVIPPMWLRVPGLILGVAGAGLAGWCVATFITRGRGTPAPFDPPREFVATGPYRYVRNPMYVGGFTVILGAGLALRSPSIVVLALAFLLIAQLFVVLYEEPTLSARFGATYEAYRASVHRWLPGRRPHRDAAGGVG